MSSDKNSIASKLERPAFFPNSKAAKKRGPITKDVDFTRDALDKHQDVESIAKNDVKVDISDKVKDFSYIRSAVDRSSHIDNSEKIGKLQEQIRNGRYEIDYEALADKMLKNEF